VAGLRRLGAPVRCRKWRAFWFLGGLLLLYLSLQSPLDALARHFFFIHQIQHQLLPEIVPIMLVLPGPQANLIAGLPRPVKERMLVPLLRARTLRRAFLWLSHPVTATFLFVSVCWFWNVPPIHDQTVLSERVDELAHLTMLAAGFVYWWRVLDSRPPPAGSSYVVRLFMLKIAMMSMALIGGYLTLKQIVVYGVYDRLGLDMAAVTDEAIGGVILWLGGAVAPFAAGAVLACRWRHDPDWEVRASRAANPTISR
jgi:putative membrane protein